MLLTVYKFLKFVFRYGVPARGRYGPARWIARQVCRFNASRREVIIGNLTPLVGKEKAALLAPELLGHFAMTAVDFFCASPRRGRDDELENWSVIGEAYRRTQRVMVVTAHLGYWEIGVSYLLEKGFPVTGVYAPYTDDAIVQWIMGHRNPQAEWIPAIPGAAERCIAAVEKGRVLGMVADIPFGERGRRVTIAGHPARLPIGPWMIAARARATVIPTFIVRRSPGRYRGIAHEPIQPATGSLPRQIRRMQAIYKEHLERYLKTYPEQWGVLAPFWE